MNEFFAILWDIFAVIGLACIATTLGGLLLLWLSGRSEAKRWAELQEPQTHSQYMHDYRAQFMDRTDEPYTLPVNGRRF